MTNGIVLNSLYKSCDKGDMKFRLSAGIMIGKHIVPKSISCNSDRTLIHGEIFHSKHAEHGAILYLKNKKKRNNIKLILIRIDAFGKLVNSTPCESCIHRIKNVGIKKIIYVNHKHILVEEHIDQIKFIPATKKTVSQWFNKVKPL
jgi:deoxycytidylate deaminase